jgi:hypothetical protein
MPVPVSLEVSDSIDIFKGKFQQNYLYLIEAEALSNKLLRLMGLDPFAFKLKSTLVSDIICGTGHSQDYWSGTLKWDFVEDEGTIF